MQNDCSVGYVDGIDKYSDPTFQQSADFVKGMLAVHNRERALVGVPPLVWDETLAAGAKAWADHLATTGVPSHDDPNMPDRTGENAGTPISYAPIGWINEKKYYHGGPVDNLEAGHYLQMVWRTATAVGCGTALNPYEMLVCRYSPGIFDLGEMPY